MSSTPDPIDASVARELGLAALREVTPDATIGDLAGSDVNEDGVLSLRFANLLPGYPGWFWTVSLAQVADAEPTVLEVELLPGDDALLAPDWVPWAERLAEYQAAQAALAETSGEDDAAEDDETLDDDDLDDVDDLDAVDFDEDGSAILHSGDVDGVDIDAFADQGDEPDESDEESEEDSDDDEDDSDEDDSDEDDESDED